MNQIASSSLTSDDIEARVALELAIGIQPVADIIKQFSLTKAQMQQLLQEQGFRNMVKQFKSEWLAASNSKERIRLKAAVMAEHNLLVLHDIVNDMDLNPNARLEAYKQITALADVQPKKDAVESGPKFNLTLNLGGDQTVTIDAETVIDDGDDE